VTPASVKAATDAANVRARALYAADEAARNAEADVKRRHGALIDAAWALRATPREGSAAVVKAIEAIDDAKERAAELLRAGKWGGTHRSKFSGAEAERMNAEGGALAGAIPAMIERAERLLHGLGSA